MGGLRQAAFRRARAGIGLRRVPIVGKPLLPARLAKFNPAVRPKSPRWEKCCQVIEV
jgi:hypothetical protein